MKSGGMYLLVFGLVLLLLSVAFTINIFFTSKTDLLKAEGPKVGLKTVPEGDDKTGWTTFMKQNEAVRDYYPTDEITLSWDLVEADRLKETLYKVTFDNLDQYQYFCLIQVLNNRKIKRSIEKAGEHYRIYLSLHSPDAAQVLMDELKEYDIYGTVSKYKTGIKYTR